MKNKINELDDYFMKPYFLDTIGNVYPVKIFDYEQFKTLSAKYIVQGHTTLHNLYDVDLDMNLLDYFVDMGKQGDYEIENLKLLEQYTPENEAEEEQVKSMLAFYKLITSGAIAFYSIKELEELFSIVLNKKVSYKEINDKEYVFLIEDSTCTINNTNFEDLREIIMWQNLLFEPPTSPSKFGNEAIQLAIKNEFGESSSSLASICSVVSCNSGVSDAQIQEYTYYRLMYDFSIINRTHGNLFTFMLRSQGCTEAIISNLSDNVDLHKNPYDCIFNKFEDNAGNL